MGRLLTTTNALGHLTARIYDAVGNVLLTTFPDSTTETRTYDAMNRLLTTKDALNQTTTFTYHPDDSLASLKDANNQTCTFQVDALSRRTRKTYPGGSFEQWTYDGNGNALTYRTRAGAIATSTYNNRNRETLRDWNDTTPDVSMSYDAAGRLLTLGNTVATSTYTYDAANQLLSESITISGLSGAKTVSYTYDVDGSRASLTDPSGSVTTYTYTARNAVASIVADGPPPLATFTHDLAGNRLGKNLENGVQSAYTYDALNRLTSLAHGSVETLTYTYDKMNRRTGEARSSAPTRTFGYDLTGQLTSVNQSSGNATFAYDAVGNRTTVTGAPRAGSYTANSLNQYTTAGGVGALTYDANGNMTSDGTRTYAWDAENRLIKITEGTKTTDIEYDGFHHWTRIVERNGATTVSDRRFIWDGNTLVEQRNGTSTTAAQRYLPQGVQQGTSKFFYTRDHLGSIREVVNNSGAVVARYDYDPYGRRTKLSGTFDSDFGFTGHYFHAPSGLHFAPFRAYSAEFGRWISRDPIEEAGGIYLYGYVSNNPINLVDPLGLFNPYKGLSALGNAVNAGRLYAGGALKLAGAAGLTTTGAGASAGAGAAALGSWNLWSGQSAWNRSLQQWNEALNEDWSDRSWKNLLGVLPFGTEFDDPCEPSPWEILKDKANTFKDKPREFIQEIGSFGF